MTTLFLSRHSWAVCVSTLVLSACSVDRAPFPVGDAGGRADSGGPDATAFDAATEATVDATDAMDAIDAALDAVIESDAGSDDASTIDAGDSGTLSCMNDQDCAPRVCHEANCATGTCIYTPQPLGPATDVPQLPNDCQTIYCDGNGGLTTFGDSLDPPLDDGDFCTLEACSNTTPLHVGLPDGTQLPFNDQVPGDCRVKRCAGGATVDVTDDSDLPMSNACDVGTCSGGVPGTSDSAAGLSCGNGQVCDGAGSCVACLAQTATCSDDWQCCGGNCVGGQCGTACMNNFADCDGMDNNGCETATNTLTNCGACGTTCNLANATEACTTGTCAITNCNTGFANCNGLANDGCEQSLRTLSDCGSCGNACVRSNATATCSNSGVCGLGACNAGWGNCDNNAANGCEAALNTINNCGGCGVACGFPNAISVCASGTCQQVGCESGFDDCDNNPSNGCEASLTSINDCGACDVACSGPANRVLSCDGIDCNVGACVTGFQDCDGNADNGCEWDASNGACPCMGTDDTDGDGLTNCTEIEDGDDFTDPDAFNGASVVHYAVCDTAFGIDCDNTNTLAEVNDCTNKTPHQTLNQYSGWDFQDPSGSPNAINNAGFGFLPNWSGTNTSFQLDARAFIKVATTGRHCFRVNGGTGGSCGSLFLSTTSADTFCGWASISEDTAPVVQHGDNAVCLSLDAGVYPVRWHLDRNSGAQGDFHLDYCAGGNSDCSPVDAIPSRMLRVEYPADCEAPATACTQATFSGNGHDYWFCDDAMTWTAARTACQAIGMDLVAIGNASENTFVTGMIDNDSWIALSDSLSESTWMWMTTYSPIWTGGPNGTQIPNTYVNWADGDPNGDNTRNCGELMTNGEWNDTTCGTAQAFVCEEQ